MSDHVKPSVPSTQAAVTLLARRALSEVELRQRLAQRGYDTAAIDEALNSMRGYRYIDDAKLAEGVAHAALRRGKGPQWVRATLRRRGVAAELADAAAGTPEPQALVAQARALLLRRYGAPALADKSSRAKAFRFLCGRGFSADCAMQALNPIQAADDDDPPPEA